VRLVFLGPPGAGKGTQSKLLANKLGIPHISTGDIIRDSIKNKTLQGAEFERYSNEGKLVPDELVVSIVVSRLLSLDCIKGFILDGFPRNINQAQILDAHLLSGGIHLTHVICFDIEDAFIIERLTGRRTCSTCGAIYHVSFSPSKLENKCDKCHGLLVQRPDDSQEVVSKRLNIYHEQTYPLVQYYENKRLLVKVNAKLSMDSVQTYLLGILA